MTVVNDFTTCGSGHWTHVTSVGSGQCADPSWTVILVLGEEYFLMAYMQVFC